MKIQSPFCRRKCLLIFLTLLAFSSPVSAGWLWEWPANVVTITSAKRNHVFYVGEEVRFTLNRSSAVRYEVKNYYGELVDSGDSVPLTLTLNVTDPGWYKLYLFGSQNQDPWGYSVGGTTFCIFRNDPRFPQIPKNAPNGSHSSVDLPARALVGIGPERHRIVDASNPAAEIAKLAGDIALDKLYYTPYDPLRNRRLMAAFANGTSNLDGVRQIVEYFKNDIEYWEPRNEPNFGSNAADFVNNELRPFYETVKSVDPNLKVLGPGLVTIGPAMAGWHEAFFQAGGGDYIDAFSFHAYNNVNGDLWLTRKALDDLKALLERYGKEDIELWQTEQGFMAPVYGSYQPRLQGRWTMLMMMVYEQYGIPKEQNHYWYDRSHGFWDFPMFFVNDDSSLNPAAPLMRVWSEELHGTNFSRKFNFGQHGEALYVGSLFTGPEKAVAAFMSAGSTDGSIEILLPGANQATIVSPFGKETTVQVNQGKLILPVTELPSYVRVKPGQSIDVKPIDFGPNLTRLADLTITASGAATHPVNSSIPNSVTKLVNGELENWYWAQGSIRPWMSNNSSWPGWVQLTWSEPRDMDRVVIFACPPWQWEGTLLDYELQYRQSGAWVTIEHVQEPTKTQKVYSPILRTTVDSFFSDRWVFQHQFPTINTDSIRILVHKVTYGGGATKEVQEAGGQTGPHQISLREIQVFNTKGPKYSITGRVTHQDGSPIADVPVTLSGFHSNVVSTNANGEYTFEELTSGGNYTWSLPNSGADYEFSPPEYRVNNLTGPVTADFTAAAVAQNQGTGLKGYYYDGTNFNTLHHTRTDPTINFWWNMGGPFPALGNDHFTIRWLGHVQPRYSETYTFYVRSDDGASIWVNGERLVNNLIQQPSTEKSGAIQLQAGKKYTIRVDYVEFGGGAECKLYWSSPSQPKEIIPASRLYPFDDSYGTPTPVPPGLSVTIQGNPTNPKPGDTVAFTLNYQNTSAATASDTRIVFPLPAKTTYVNGSASAGGTYHAASREVRWTIPSLAPGASGQVTLQVTID